MKRILVFSFFLVLLVVAVFVSACTPSDEDAAPSQGSETKGDAQDVEATQESDLFVVNWRILSERIFYDIGGAGATAVPVTRNVELRSDASWSFGDSTGTWMIQNIADDDWVRWGVDSYGPTRKMILEEWHDGRADGPIEERDGVIDFFWIIYHVDPPLVENAGTVWLKLGHN